MADWATFAGLVGVVTCCLLLLSRLTESTLAGSDAVGGDSSGKYDRVEVARHHPDPDADRNEGVGGCEDADWRIDRRGGSDGGAERVREVGSAAERSGAADETVDHVGEVGPSADVDDRSSRPTNPAVRERPDGLSTGALLANVALSQGLFAGLLLGAAVYAEIPADAIGVAFDRAYLLEGVVLGTGSGIGLYAANELGEATATRFGIDHDEGLRRLLAPDSGGGWLVLLGIVLPVIALFEEFLFRAALVGAVSVGFGVSPWLLAVLSSVAFALGHGVQGTAGIVVTGALGFVLAAIFVVTGSLLVVVVAHYLVNALEFLVHEWLGVEWDGGTDPDRTTGT